MRGRIIDLDSGTFALGDHTDMVGRRSKTNQSFLEYGAREQILTVYRRSLCSFFYRTDVMYSVLCVYVGRRGLLNVARISAQTPTFAKTSVRRKITCKLGVLLHDSTRAIGSTTLRSHKVTHPQVEMARVIGSG